LTKGGPGVVALRASARITSLPLLGFWKAFSPLRDQPLEITRIEQNSPADPHGNQANPQSVPLIRQAAWFDSKGLGGLRKAQKLHISSL
jgi:hypothetical protein